MELKCQQEMYDMLPELIINFKSSSVARLCGNTFFYT